MEPDRLRDETARRSRLLMLRRVFICHGCEYVSGRRTEAQEHLERNDHWVETLTLKRRVRRGNRGTEAQWSSDWEIIQGSELDRNLQEYRSEV